MAFATVTVTTSATLIVAANVDRQSLVLHNQGTEIVYIGDDNTVTTANAIPILPNEKLLEDPSGTQVFQGDVYGITGASTSDFRYWERTRGAT